MNLSKSAELKSKEYRHGLVNAQIEVDLPLQIRALRKQLVGTQPDMATLTGMKQPRISAMEKPGGAHFTLETLRRLAEAFDVALIVRFAPFTELLDWSGKFNADTFRVPSFAEEAQTQTAEAEKATAAMTVQSGMSLEALGGLGLSHPIDEAFQAMLAKIQQDQYQRIAPYLALGNASLGAGLGAESQKIEIMPLREMAGSGHTTYKSAIKNVNAIKHNRPKRNYKKRLVRPAA